MQEIAEQSRQRHLRRVLLAFGIGIVGVAGVALLTLPLPRGVDVIDVTAGTHDHVIYLSVASCGNELAVNRLLQGDDRVSVSVTAVRPIIQSGTADCADGTTIQLTHPLGNRTVLDLTSGHEFTPKP